MAPALFYAYGYSLSGGGNFILRSPAEVIWAKQWNPSHGLTVFLMVNGVLLTIPRMMDEKR